RASQCSGFRRSIQVADWTDSRRPGFQGASPGDCREIGAADRIPHQPRPGVLRRGYMRASQARLYVVSGLSRTDCLTLCSTMVWILRSIGTGLLVVAAVLMAGASVRADEIIDRVLAVVAGDMIMLSDVIAARDLGLVQPVTAADPIREVLSRLIDRALILD